MAVALPVASPRGQTMAPELPLLLVAQPALRDPLFGATVVLALRTPAGDVVGLILNRPLDEPAAPSAGADAGGWWRGGPLAPAALFALAENGQAVDGTLDAGDGVRFAAGSTVAGRLLAAPGTLRRRLFRGYAGWAPGQLEREIASGFWRPHPVGAGQVFDPDPKGLWQRMMASQRAVLRPLRPGTPRPA